MAFDHKALLSEIQDQYLENDNNRPWIIAFSGGKDSTTLLQLVWYALQRLPQDKSKRFEGYPRSIYVICNNTLVENPQIIRFVNKQLKAAAAEARVCRREILHSKAWRRLSCPSSKRDAD